MNSLRKRLYDIVFETDTKAGRQYDIFLLIMVMISVVLVLLESIQSINEKYYEQFYVMEWILTIYFTIDYLLRVFTVKNPLKYIFSFYGLVDLISTLPMYIGLYTRNYNSLAILRVLRLLRIFKVLNLTQYTSASYSIIDSIRQNKNKIIIVITTVLSISLIQGALLYIIEGPENGFTSIPLAMYFAIVTITTVGYGDLAPLTPLGKMVAATSMIIGYAIIAIGIVSDKNSNPAKINRTNSQVCPNCLKDDHRDGASYCYNCGESLES